MKIILTDGLFDQGVLAGERISDAVKTIALPSLGTGIGTVGANIGDKHMIVEPEWSND